jgi:hypothetical protein
MDLVRDLLDKKLSDRNGREMGRVDRVVLGVRAGAPLRVLAIDVGASALASRLHPIFGRWVAGLEHALGVDEGRPLRIMFQDVTDIHDHIKVDLAFGETAAATIEQRLRRVVASIPGAS